MTDSGGPAGQSAAISLSVSIVTYRGSVERLRRTVVALSEAVRYAAKHLPRALVCELRLIDNSPAEEVAPNPAQWLNVEQFNAFLGVESLRRPENPGFGAANNQVIRDADSDYHLVLNPDAELAIDALLEGLNFLAHHPLVVAVSPRVFAPDGRRKYLAKAYPSVLILAIRGFAPAWLARLFQGRLDEYELRTSCSDDVESADVPLASGCCMLARTAAMQQVGGFDEAYFLYFEDFDLSLRLSSLGSIVYLRDMGLLHHGGDTAAKGWRHIGYFLRSAWRFFCTHGWRWI